jgi:very-short-patch-repair endonuclease
MGDSPLELELLQQIRWAGLPEPEREYRACHPRRYRWDMAYPKINLLIEVQGGIWRKSAHSTGVGISRDYEKNNIAVANGWRVLYFSAGMVHSGKALELIEKELNK